VEPFDQSELVVRINRILTKELRSNGSEIIECGDLIIDVGKCEVYLNNRLLSLTFTEYELLRFLAKNRGRVFTRDALLNEVWGYDYFGGDRTVDVHIRRLRNKIEDQDHIFVETVRNIGYKFKEATFCNKNLTCL
jgi:DNA-binding response OmpR family regulator